MAHKKRSSRHVVPPLPKTCGDRSPEEILDLTRHPDPKERRRALHEMCPCQTLAEVDLLWDRIIEMTDDVDPIVRDQALHNLGDGSPKHLEFRILEVLEKLYNDSDKNVRKKARKMFTAYQRNGKWNVL